MSFDEAVIELFAEAASTTGRMGASSIQINVCGSWATVPLEWNKAIRLAELSGCCVQIVDGDGDVVRTFDPVARTA